MISSKGTYIKAWLLTILRNTFINEYRRKARRPIEVELTGIEAVPELMLDAGIHFEAPKGGRDELLELLDDPVRKAVEELPEDFREAVIMADLEDMSYKEIAEVMRCPLGTVMSRLYRGVNCCGCLGELCAGTESGYRPGLVESGPSLR